MRTLEDNPSDYILGDEKTLYLVLGRDGLNLKGQGPRPLDHNNLDDEDAGEILDDEGYLEETDDDLFSDRTRGEYSYEIYEIIS